MTHPRSASAFTLMEMAIAILIFGLATAAVFQALIGTRHLASQGAAVDQVELESGQALREIANDLTTSGWEFVDTPATQTRNNVQNTATSIGTSPSGDYSASALNTGGGGQLGIMANDRLHRYYPFVQLDNAPGLRFPWTALNTSTLPTRTTVSGTDPLRVLPGQRGDHAVTFGSTAAGETAWSKSFFARSQELIFLRSQIGAWSQKLDPSDTGNAWSNLGISASTYAARRPSDAPRPALGFTYAYTTVGAPGSGSTPVPGTQTTAELTAADWRTAGNHARLGVLYPAGFHYDVATQAWSELFPSSPYGVVLDAGWYDPNDTTTPIKPLWESMSKLAVTPNFYGTSAQDLREFMYAVVPSPIPTSLGRLVRAYRVTNATSYPTGKTDPGYRITATASDTLGSGPSGSPPGTTNCFVPYPPLVTPPTDPVCGMVVDKVLAEDVVRAVFDTYRSVDAGLGAAGTVQSLGINQVRVRLYLARRQISNPNNIIYRIAESTVSMRARASSSEMAAISTVLGSAPVGINR